MQRSFLLAAILIAIGYISPQAPDVLRETWGRIPSGTSPVVVRTLITLGLGAPLLPLLIAVSAPFTRRRVPDWLIWLIAGWLTLAGVFTSLMASAFSDKGELIVLLQGITLTGGVAGAVLILSDTERARKNASMLLLLPSIVALWSISVAGVVAISASAISDGKAYCLARDDKQPITALQELRGLSFYTTREWGFHGMLVVQQDDGPMAYIWSPRRMRFEHISSPESLTPEPRSICVPQDGFLGKLTFV